MFLHYVFFVITFDSDTIFHHRVALMEGEKSASGVIKVDAVVHSFSDCKAG